MYINGIDYVDNKIVRLLKDNARMSYSDIASEIGLSRTAVTTRITNLEKAGIIKGYNTILKNELLSFVLSIETKTDVFEEWKDLDFKTGTLKIARQVYTVEGELIITEPKTKTSVRTIILPQSVLEVLKKYKETVDSQWMFPSPVKKDCPREPHSIYKKTQLILERAECPKVRFHDLRHTFATTALANGMDVKTLSNMIGHISSQTTMDIYLHTTEEMQKQAARKIENKMGKNENGTETLETKATTDTKKASKPKFEAKKGKYRKSGTGCISKINDKLYEGRYSPRLPNGKRISKNIYAPTYEECEEKLAVLIKKMKAEIQEERMKMEQGM